MVRLKFKYCFIVFLLLLLSALYFTACNTQSTNRLTPENQKAHDGLQVVIEQYKQANEEAKKSTDPYYWMHITSQKKYQYVYCDEGENPNRYAFLDLNHDGIDELVISRPNYLASIYSYIDNKPVLTLASWVKSRTTIRNDFILWTDAPSGAYAGIITIGRYNPTNLESPSETDNLTTIKKYEWDSFMNQPTRFIITDENGNKDIQLKNEPSALKDLNDELEKQYPLKNDIDWQLLDD